MWTVALMRWLTLIAGGLSFGLTVIVLVVFTRLRKMGRVYRLPSALLRDSPHHIVRMAIAHLGLTLFVCAWLVFRIQQGAALGLSIATPYLLFVLVVSDAGLIGLLWNEYTRTLEPKDVLSKDEGMGLKREADAVHVELRERIEALEKR